jgi:hypothetical protein
MAGPWQTIDHRSRSIAAVEATGTDRRPVVTHPSEQFLDVVPLHQILQETPERHHGDLRFRIGIPNIVAPTDRIAQLSGEAQWLEHPVDGPPLSFATQGQVRIDQILAVLEAQDRLAVAGIVALDFVLRQDGGEIGARLPSFLDDGVGEVLKQFGDVDRRERMAASGPLLRNAETTDVLFFMTDLAHARSAAY